MFGSSEDRARQLAARTRRQRISSGGSQSSYRSTTLSIPVSQQCQTTSTSESIRQDRISSGQHTSGVSDHDQSVHPVGNQSPLAASGKPYPTTQQHSAQAEYLSQVLYNNASIADMPVPPQSQFVLPVPTKRYGSLGSHSTISHQLRNMTAPISPTQMMSFYPGFMQTQLGVPMLPPLQQPDYNDHLRVQTVVSLRGGGLFEDENRTPLPRARGHQPSMQEFPWVGPTSSHALWAVPICSGECYEAFLASLSSTQFICFQTYFGPGPLLLIQAAAASKSRRPFYRGLSFAQRQLFRDTINERGMEILKRILEESVGVSVEHDDTSTAPYDPTKPAVMLRYLLEATHDPPETKLRFTSNELFHPSVQAMSRATSAPDLGQQQKTQQGYYSGGGGSGSASSSATKSTLNKLFDKYRENAAGEPDAVGVEGTMQYFEELDVDLEGLDALAAFEVVQAPTMGDINREGFVNGWQERSCETVDKQKAYLKNLSREMAGSKEVFTRIYKYSFQVAKPANQKAVPLDSAVAYWDILFSSPISAVKWTSPNNPWLDWWKEFLTSSWKKSVNKDMWNETLKFANLTLQDEAMSFWNEESSWPSVIDEFVEWVKEKRGDKKEEVVEDY